MDRCLIPVITLGIALFASNALATDKNKIRVFAGSIGNEITIELVETPGWCKPDLTFTARAQEDIYFNGLETNQEGKQGRLTLQRVLGGIRLGLQSECPEAKSVTLRML